MDPAGQQGRQEQFGLLDVAILILEAVGVLHARGRQRLRIYPGMSPSGMHWRTAVYQHQPGIQAQAIRGPGTFLYTTGSEYDVAGLRAGPATAAGELADAILATAGAGDWGSGQDREYAGWYVGLLGLVRQHHAVPVAYADYFDPEPGWEIGWGSGIRIPPPPG